MADISGYLRSKLDKFKQTIAPPPPIQVDFSKYNQTPRVQQAIQQTQPLVQRAEQLNAIANPVSGFLQSARRTAALNFNPSRPAPTSFSQAFRQTVPQLRSNLSEIGRNQFGANIQDVLSGDPEARRRFGDAALSFDVSTLPQVALGGIVKKAGKKATSKLSRELIPELEAILRRTQDFGPGSFIYNTAQDALDALRQYGDKANPNLIRSAREAIEFSNQQLARTATRPVLPRTVGEGFQAQAINPQAGFLDPMAFLPKGLQRRLGRSAELPTPNRASVSGSLNQTDNAAVGFARKADGTIDRTKLTGMALSRTNEELTGQYSNIIRRSKDITPREKIGLLDYFRTPDRVLNKLGLNKEADLLRQQYDKYVQELPVEIDRITQWANRAADPAANQRIFQYLDGRGGMLNPQELQIASEIQEYLAKWADRLGLPKDKRIASYITHIFEDDFIEKEFDPDLARIIADKVPGQVYDPFLEKRLGAQGYIEDTWAALDAYVKRATRKANMDPALKQIKEVTKNFEESQYKYIKRYTDRINLRPTEIDNLLDNTIKQVIGYKLTARPTAYVSRKLRNWVYRGTLGLNFGSALRNLTQGVNTYKELGEEFTIKGYATLVKHLASNDLDELKRVGVLADNIIQDRKLSAVKGTMEQVDKGLWAAFDLAEKINRGSAYYGAKAKFLKAGLTEEQAIKKAVKVVRDTQFTFGSIDTPVALQSDLVKLGTQFMSYPVKQAEFMIEAIGKREWAGIARFIGATVVFQETIGQSLGYEWKDYIPFYSQITGESRFSPPVVSLGRAAFKRATGGEDEFGQPVSTLDVIKEGMPFVPAGVQGRKTYEGLKAAKQGYSASKSGRARYPVGDGPLELLRTGTLGQYSGPVARYYFDNKLTPFGDKDTEALKRRIEAGEDPKRAYYNLFVQKTARSEKSPEEKQRLIDGMREVLGIQDVGASEGVQPLSFTTPTPGTGTPAARLPKTPQQRKDALQRVKDVVTGGLSGDQLNVALMDAQAVKVGNGGRMDGTYFWTDDEGKFKFVDFNTFKKSPDKAYLAGKQEKQLYSELSSMEKGGADEMLINRALGELGIPREEYQYYQVAREDVDTRSDFVLDMVKETPREELIETLTPLRAKVGGKQLLTNPVIDDLYKAKIITSGERKLLKSIDFDRKTGTARVKGGGTARKGRKPAKVTVAKVKAAKVPSLASTRRAARKTPRISLKVSKRSSKPIRLRARKTETVDDFKKRLLARK